MKKTTSVCRPALLSRLICAALGLAAATHVLADDSGNADKTAVKSTTDKNNAISGAEDGFGNQSGKESIGIYDDGNVRGFSPSKAGNLRIEGMYFDRAAYLGHLLTDGSKVRVGATVSGYAFPAPTGIVDYELRKAGDQREWNIGLEMEQSARGRGDRATDVNLLLPLNPGTDGLRYGVSVAGSLYQEITPGREASFYRSAAVVGRIRSAENAAAPFEILPFYSLDQTPYETPHPYWQTTDGQLPPASALHLSYPAALHAPWLRASGNARTYGVIAHQQLSEDWHWRASLIRSHAKHRQSFDQVFSQTAAQQWQRSLISEQGNERDSRSAEIRLSKRWQTADNSHWLHLIWRGRHAQQRYGGEAESDGGSVFAETGLPALNRPGAFSYTAKSSDNVQQSSQGLAYAFAHPAWQLNLGIMQTRYEKQTRDGGTQTERRIEESQLQPYWHLSHRLSDTLSVYGGQTQGLEESGVAPVSASNRFEVLPPIRTRQHDLGVRWQGELNAQRFNAVLGYFDVSKPYYGYNAAQAFALTGTVRHRGLEGSIAGNLHPQLNMVMAAVWQDATLSRTQGGTTIRPAGSIPLEWRSYLDYHPQQLADTSFDLGLQYSGPQTTSETTGSRLPKKVLVQLGARYQFRVQDMQAQLRLQVSNLFNRDNWNMDSENSFQPGKPRTWRLVLTLSQ